MIEFDSPTAIAEWEFSQLLSETEDGLIPDRVLSLKMQWQCGL